MGRSNACSHSLVALVFVGCGRAAFDPIPASGLPDAPGSAPEARSRLDLDRHAPAEPLTDFPLLVVLDDTRADRALFGADASTLRFRDADGALIPHEIDTPGEAGSTPTLAWVRVPSYQADTTSIFVEYGGTPAELSPDPVWLDDYVAVWHLARHRLLSDSTSTQRDLFLAPGAAYTEGMLGTGLELDAVEEDYATTAQVAVPDMAALTVSAWVRLTSMTGDHATIVSRQYEDTGEDDFWMGISTINTFYSWIHTEQVWTTVEGPMPNVAGLMFLAVTWEAGTARLYSDGVLVSTESHPGTVVSSTGNPITLGANIDNSGTRPPGVPDAAFLDGSVDEVRVCSTARSPAWFAAEDATGRDGVITYGAIEHL